ncbi:ABC transporter ATP-binding protein [Candidatus Enterococcus willemsii]|uniref:ABC transporter ATP-binding protein n=1 Tax=Candidatus Enterococcus willemsii TaxID=1857215 RepID=A0ABQ6Z1V9_9ENTE|nr:ABC transporter ATP-binding protein [Enterococcus sp. CU12B]KAF1305521.1 ABC transporter ATP-binding protein [Enterococcus sp. CU12B]
MSNVLSIQNVSKKIGNKQIIHGATFHVEKGEIVGLLGPNGAGKTTLIRMIVGLMKHNGGQINILDYSLDTNFKEAMTEVGAIIENPEFYNYMTGYENLMQYARMSKKEVNKVEIERIIAQVHLENNINQKVKTYSLGMRQRLGVAQALVHQPHLLVLDEPMNGLDPKGMREFREMILLLKANGVSVLVSSHQLSDIEQLADRLVILQKGKITHQVTMAEIHGSGRALLLDTTDNLTVMKILETQGITNIQQEKNYLLIPLDEDIRIELAKQIVEASIGLREMKVKQSTLEDTFLAWTEEGGL